MPLGLTPHLSQFSTRMSSIKYVRVCTIGRATTGHRSLTRTILPRKTAQNRVARVGGDTGADAEGPVEASSGPSNCLTEAVIVVDQAEQVIRRSKSVAVRADLPFKEECRL